jgi:hypothetical protein
MERRRSDFILLILAGVKQKLEGSHEILPSHVTRQCSPKDISAPAQRAPETSSEDAHAQGAPARMSWARLLKRVFDIEHCPNCGGALKIIAAIEDPPVIVKILSHLGLPTRAPPRARRVESIYSIQSEKPKTACQRKPIMDLSRVS